ncbi:hypothetical protein SAFG77S_08051 [Streptomyces afghaniensis]
MSLVMTFAMQDFVVMTGDYRRTRVVDEGEYYDDTPKVIQLSPKVLCGFTGDLDITKSLRKELEGLNPKATIEAVARKVRKVATGYKDAYQTVTIAGKSDSGKMAIIQVSHHNNFRIEKIPVDKGRIEWRFSFGNIDPTEYANEHLSKLTECTPVTIAQLAKGVSEKVSEVDSLVSERCDVLILE